MDDLLRYDGEYCNYTVYTLRKEVLSREFPDASEDTLKDMCADVIVFKDNKTDIYRADFYGGYGRVVWSRDELIEFLRPMAHGKWWQ